METMGKNNLAGCVYDKSYCNTIKLLDEKIAQGYIPLTITPIANNGQTMYCASFYKAQAQSQVAVPMQNTNQIPAVNGEGLVDEFTDLFGGTPAPTQSPTPAPTPAAQVSSPAVTSNGVVVGKCPVCGGDMVMNSSGYVKCQNKACGAQFSKYFGRNLTQQELISIFSGQKTTLNNLTYNGKTFKRVVVLEGTKDANGWLQLKKVS